VIVTTGGCEVKWDQDCVVVTLACPERSNALSPEVLATLADVVSHASLIEKKMLFLRSNASVFCAGADLSHLAGVDQTELADYFGQVQNLLDNIRSTRVLTVALVGGAAVGAGADLVAACDLRLGTNAARFRFPGSAFGLVLGLGRLSELIGTGRATYAAVTRNWISAADAYTWGLLDVLHPGWGDLGCSYELLLERVAEMPAEQLSDTLATARSAQPADDRSYLLRTTARPDVVGRLTAFRRSALGSGP
jgi:enoyl-CoA hydratase/carnithine racemase